MIKVELVIPSHFVLLMSTLAANNLSKTVYICPCISLFVQTDLKDTFQN